MCGAVPPPSLMVFLSWLCHKTMTGKMELLKDLRQSGVTPDNFFGFFRRFQTMASNVAIKPSKHRQASRAG